MSYTKLEYTIKNLPPNPGVYKYLDKEGKIIYIGKAKNLKKRVASYFNKELQSYKTEVLVRHIVAIEFIIVNNEHDAFLLENNLIKEFKPKYNINLKDDKTFPYIVIKNEPFPRLIFSRQKKNDGAEYLGPFTNVLSARFIFDFIKEHYPLRTCNLNLTPQKIALNRYKLCLEYHIKKCKGPCKKLQTAENYSKNIEEIRILMKNGFKNLVYDLKQKMLVAAEHLQFELAQEYKYKIQMLENFDTQTMIESATDLTLDIFSIEVFNKVGLVNYMKVREGKISFTQNIQLETRLGETKEEILEFAILQLYIEDPCEVKEIVTPFNIDFWNKDITITVPLKGDKKKFLELSIKNVEYLKQEKIKLEMMDYENIEDEKKQVLQELKSNLFLKELPTHIECFDNSNFQGSYPVSAMVCFRNGIPSKKDYRVFKVKSVEGIDDFATMREVVFRRYKRLKENNLPLPNLVIIDGGKGQLNAAMESIKKIELQGKMTLIGVAKNQEEIFFYKDKESIKLNYLSNSLKLIIQIRDEVHRFGIQFHRKLRMQGTIKTELSNIDGIGDILAQKLLRFFGSVKNIKQQSEEDLAQIVGKVKANLIIKYFQ